MECTHRRVVLMVVVGQVVLQVVRAAAVVVTDLLLVVMVVMVLVAIDDLRVGWSWLLLLIVQAQLIQLLLDRYHAVRERERVK